MIRIACLAQQLSLHVFAAHGAVRIPNTGQTMGKRRSKSSSGPDPIQSLLTSGMKAYYGKSDDIKKRKGSDSDDESDDYIYEAEIELRARHRKYDKLTIKQVEYIILNLKGVGVTAEDLGELGSKSSFHMRQVRGAMINRYTDRHKAKEHSEALANLRTTQGSNYKQRCLKLLCCALNVPASKQFRADKDTTMGHQMTVWQEQWNKRKKDRPFFACTAACISANALPLLRSQ
ncbi:MAG: hypothetical protein GY813_05740 [Halieaceae bacterium]|nr:hypothetical protein [Halieaceae bacterium]